MPAGPPAGSLPESCRWREQHNRCDLCLDFFPDTDAAVKRRARHPLGDSNSPLNGCALPMRTQDAYTTPIEQAQTDSKQDG